MNNLITNLPLLNEENIFRNYQILIQNTKQENKLKYEKLNEKKTYSISNSKAVVNSFNSKYSSLELAP